MIELYPRDQTEFSHHGKILNDVSNDVVTWKLNSEFTLTFDYPLISKYGSELVEEMIVTVPVPGGTEPFRISAVQKSMGLLTINAYHVFFDLNDNFIADTNVVDKDAQSALNQILAGANFETGFTASSTIGNINSARLVRMSVTSALLGTDDNSFLSRWGGEFDWHGFAFTVAPKLGKDRGVRFAYAHNLLGYTATKDTTDIITRFMPEGYDGLLLPELYVDSPHIADYLHPKVAQLDCSTIKAQSDGNTDEDALPLEDAYTAMRDAAKAQFDTGVDMASWTYKLNVVLLENTEEYKNIGVVTSVLPGDTVTVQHSDDGIDVKARLTEYTWQPTAKQYLTQVYDSTQSNGVSDPAVVTAINSLNFKNAQLIDKVTQLTTKQGTVTWSDQSPIDLGLAGKEGQVFYQELSDGTVHMWIFENGKWVDKISDMTGAEIAKSVDEKLAELSTAMDDLNAKLETNATDIASAKVAIAKAQTHIDSSLEAAKTETAKAIADAQDVADKANTALSADLSGQLDAYKDDVAKQFLDANNGWDLKYTTINGQISELTQTVNGYQSKFDDGMGDLTQQLLTANGLITKAQTAADAAKSLSVQNANDILLRVQKGDIISELNMEAGSTLIKSDKIYLAADTVAFSGEAIIPSAVIKSLDATKITTGTLDALKATIINFSADSIVSGALDASKVTVKNLLADSIIGGVFDAGLITVKNLSASIITAGTLDASLVNLINLNADNIVTGTLSAIDIVGSTITGSIFKTSNDNGFNMMLHDGKQSFYNGDDYIGALAATISVKTGKPNGFMIEQRKGYSFTMGSQTAENGIIIPLIEIPAKNDAEDGTTRDVYYYGHHTFNDAMYSANVISLSTQDLWIVGQSGKSVQIGYKDGDKYWAEMTVNKNGVQLPNIEVPTAYQNLSFTALTWDNGKTNYPCISNYNHTVGIAFGTEELYLFRKGVRKAVGSLSGG